MEAPQVTVQAEVTAPGIQAGPAPVTPPPASQTATTAAPALFTAPPPPPQMTPHHQAIEIEPPATEPVDPSLEKIVVPALRKVAEMIRGPRSKTILLDGKLVDLFDALRDAEDLADVLAALKPIKKKGRS